MMLSISRLSSIGVALRLRTSAVRGVQPVDWFVSVPASAVLRVQPVGWIVSVPASAVLRVQPVGWIVSAPASAVLRVQPVGWIVSAPASAVLRVQPVGWIVSVFTSAVLRVQPVGWIVSVPASAVLRVQSVELYVGKDRKNGLVALEMERFLLFVLNNCGSILRLQPPLSYFLNLSDMSSMRATTESLRVTLNLLARDRAIAFVIALRGE